jgi:hypothetical protein
MSRSSLFLAARGVLFVLLLLSFSHVVNAADAAAGAVAALSQGHPPGAVATVTQGAPLSPPAAPSSDVTDDLSRYGALVLEAVTSGNWCLVAALAIAGLVALVRKIGGDRWPLLHSDRANVIFVLLLSFLGAVVTALAAGGPAALTAGLVLTAFKVAFVAGGGFAMVKRLAGASKVQVAEAAGTAAVAATPSSGLQGIVGTPRPV